MGDVVRAAAGVVGEARRLALGAAVDVVHVADQDRVLVLDARSLAPLFDLVLGRARRRRCLLTPQVPRVVVVVILGVLLVVVVPAAAAPRMRRLPRIDLILLRCLHFEKRVELDGLPEVGLLLRVPLLLIALAIHRLAHVPSMHRGCPISSSNRREMYVRRVYA